jgi:hypothetical protein
VKPTHMEADVRAAFHVAQRSNDLALIHATAKLKASFVLSMSGIATGFACICPMLATQVESRWLA